MLFCFIPQIYKVKWNFANYSGLLSKEIPAVIGPAHRLVQWKFIQLDGNAGWSTVSNPGGLPSVLLFLSRKKPDEILID
jgi:hypothetical protein